MDVNEETYWTAIVDRLPYGEKEHAYAKRTLHAMEYHVWQEWRWAWAMQVSRARRSTMQQAVFEVSGRQALSVPAVQEIICYAERRVRTAMETNEC